MRVVLGNRNAVQTVTKDDQDIIEKMPRGKRATEIELDDDTSLSAAFATITHPSGIWAAHATEGATPAWVASSNPSLAQLLADHWGGLEVRALDDNPSEKKPRSRAAAAATTTLLLALLLWAIANLQFFLKTNAGNDFQAKQMGGSASATAVAKWMAITANVTAPSASSTSLTGEITTAGGGLVRAAGAYAHTTGAASYTITNTFTANGTDALPVTIGKVGVFDAASAGNLVFETLVSPTATLSASGDSLTLTQTVSL